ncbi:electron transport complex subunit RsxD [Seminibacterium arietis]|uniref:Ion-translocating oxidoreductase complex subunit D n=1 Tax=Seminibacterium arietis TaxID=1173502 RepID=A0ABW3I7F3_9PAST
MFKMKSSPHTHSGKRTAHIMLWVIVAMLPAIAGQIYYFGFGVLIQSCLAICFALLLELIVTILRKKPIYFYIGDFSIVLTALILAVAIPSYSPYWVILIGTFCAVILGKHVYGGLGQNLFNPAMVGYVILLISFPLQMTTWLPPIRLLNEPPTFYDSYSLIFNGFTSDGFSLHQLTSAIDGITQATPLDAVKTHIKSGIEHISQLNSSPIFQSFLSDNIDQISLGLGWAQINILFLVGGLFLLWKKIIHWHIPVALLTTMFTISTIHFFFSDTVPQPLWQLFSGSTMFAAFFIATDPVTASITPRGKLIFGAIVGALICLIRFKGGYPDGTAFAILLANICVPLIDHYTRPIINGHQKREIK